MAAKKNKRKKEMNASDILSNAAQTFAERRKVYGDNWKRAGAVLQAMFPNGVNLATSDDHDRFHLLSLVVVKLTRYSVSLDRGEMHQDSIHDACVYCAMVEAVDEGIRTRHRNNRANRQSNNKNRKAT